MALRYSKKTIFNTASVLHHGFDCDVIKVKQGTAFYVLDAVKFSRRLIPYFLKYLDVHVSAFRLESAY